MTTWDRERPPRRGRAPSLSDIVQTSIVIADQEGLDAVSLRRVANTLGSGTASFYRVLKNRDELLEHMVDAALGQHIPPEPSGQWRADIAAVARNRRNLLIAHSWLGSELAGRPAIGPNALAHHELALAAAAGYSDDPTVTSSAVETVLAYVFGATARELAERRVEQHSGLPHKKWRAFVTPYLQRTLSSGAYPHLNQMVSEAADLGPDDRFERGMSCVLDGLDAAAIRACGLTHKRGTAPGSAAP